jgi:hypothetical protein
MDHVQEKWVSEEMSMIDINNAVWFLINLPVNSMRGIFFEITY